MLRSLPTEEQLAYRRATVYRETSNFLAMGGGIIFLAHGVDVFHAGGPNWPALAIRTVWTALLLVQAYLLRRGRHAELHAGAAAIIIGSALLDLALLRVTGGSASPLLPFTFVLAMTMPLMAFELLGVGVAGSGLLLAGTWVMLAVDHVPSGVHLAFVNAGGGGFAAGWLLARGLVRARRADETRHLELQQAFRANEQVLGELREAVASVKTLRGLQPICAWCHRIRADSGYWEKIEAYVSAHSDATFSHGMCPSCLAEKYPEPEEQGP